MSILNPTECVALASVTDKGGLKDFMGSLKTIQAANGRTLVILSTGGTGKQLSEGGELEVREISGHTGFPEMMDGRLKTLHPKVHGGFLGREWEEGDREAMERHQITPIDIAAVNLYDFEGTVAAYKAGEKTFAEVIENIDIGGPSMLRSASKGAKVVIADPNDYADVLDDMEGNEGNLTAKLQAKLQAKVFAETASYDRKIAEFLAEHQTELEEYFADINARLAQMG